MAKWFIKKPNKSRKSFAIIRDNKTLPTDAVKAANQSYLAGDITFHEAEAIITKEMRRLRLMEEGSPHKTNLLDVNQRILDRYWETVYSHRIIRAKKAAWYRLRRAVASLDQTPLTADIHELQRAVNKYPDTQRANVPALNQILKWMGRTDVKLSKMKPQQLEVRFFTIEELRRFELKLVEPVRTLMWVAFGTGARVGEIFHLERKHLKETASGIYVEIVGQRYPDWSVGPPKNRTHKSPIIAETISWVKKWVDIPLEERRQYRNRRLANYLKKVSGNPDVRFHDLRHSYAIHLLHKQVPMELVARALGDNISVVQQYYTGFVLHDHEMETLTNLLSTK